MTVRELIAKLQSVDPDAVVFLSRDPEGNGFSSVFQVEESMPDTSLMPRYVRRKAEWAKAGVILWPE